MTREQAHLSYRDTVNYGGYYTPEKIVDTVYSLLDGNLGATDGFQIVDTSCGYGNFLKRPGSIGADIDPAALREAAKTAPAAIFFRHNSLLAVSRAQYGLRDEKLIMVGNPPYNDKTSIIKNDIKKAVCEVDRGLERRDLGLSFLLSYDRLEADYVCVLHPLSYLIKKANFESLGPFRRHYRLKDGLVISSGEFFATSKTTRFPIIIAFYERTAAGMDYDFIRGYQFQTREGRAFTLSRFDRLGRYVTKYPNQKSLALEKTAAFFWTMRDINALKRSRTFIEKEVSNAIRIPEQKLPYYCYADVFKDYMRHVPYYFGNCDIMLDPRAFEPIKEAFVLTSLRKYPFLRGLIPPGARADNNYDLVIASYFRNLLGEHYVD